MYKNLAILAILAMVLALALPAGATVVNFDDLATNTVLSGGGYAGLTWEGGNNGWGDYPGFWLIPDSISNYPYSQPRNVINAWGCTLIGIGFSSAVTVNGAYFAAQGDVTSWAAQVRVHGYLNGSEVATTGWFTDIDTNPDWFAMNLVNVNRIVIESTLGNGGGGWYGMDDLTYNAVPEPGSMVALVFGLGTLLGLRRRK